MLKAFTIYGHGGYHGHLARIPQTKCFIPFPMDVLYVVWLSLAKWFWRCLKIMVIYMYINSPGAGADNPYGQNISININLLTL